MYAFFRISILCFFISLMACNQGNSAYIANIESLQDTLALNKQQLMFDIAPFEARVVEINKNLNTLKTSYKDTLTLTDGNTFDRYKAIMKIYKRNIAQYLACNEEQKSLELQLENLLVDVKNDKYSELEFNQYFIKEKSDVTALIERTNQIKPALYEIEPEFRRLSDFVYTKLEKITD